MPKGKKLPRKKWNPIDMESAVRAVLKKDMGYLRAAKAHNNLPLTTLKDFVIKIRKENIPDEKISDLVCVGLGRKPALPEALEAELAKYCVAMDRNYFGLRRRDICRLAFQLAIRNNLKHPFCKKNKTNRAGKKWLSGFLLRHPDISFRKPQSISVSRVQSFTQENIQHFFDILKPELDKLQPRHAPGRVFNVDETGITVVQHAPEKILTVKGKKEVHKLSSAERGSLITVSMCMSAAGMFVPPMIIFPRKNRKNSLGDGAPPGSLIEYSKSGWISSELFSKWFMHFVKQTHPTADDPVVLVFDGHFSHTRNLGLIELARANHVSLVCLPPHTSNKSQPLDVSFMKPFKSYYSTAIEDWMDSHEGRILTHYELSPLFTLAYDQATTAVVAKSGFRKTGIIPYNRNVFPDYMFVTLADQNKSPLSIDTSSSATPSSSSTTSTSLISSSDLTSLLATPLALPHRLELSSRVRTALFVSPHDIRPVPCIPSAPPSNRRGTAKVISASPYKNLLAQQIKTREDKENKKEQNKQKRAANSLRKKEALKTKPKRKAKAPSSSDSDSDERVEITSKGRKKTEKPKTRSKRKKETPPSSSESEDASSNNDSSSDSDDDATCQFCGKNYKSEHEGQKWIQCSECFEWCHEICDAAAAECGRKKFVCTLCLTLKE